VFRTYYPIFRSVCGSAFKARSHLNSVVIVVDVIRSWVTDWVFCRIVSRSTPRRNFRRSCTELQKWV